MAEKQTNKERLKDITDSIETGIKELFESDKYRQYLATMSRFHKYSVNNTMLIYMQRPDATHVAGFNKWRDQFGRNVKKGVLSRVMRKYNSVTYEVGSAKAEQAAGMFGLAAGQRAASCPSRVAKPLAKPLTGGWRSATYARSQQSAPCFSRSICSSDFMLM